MPSHVRKQLSLLAKLKLFFENGKSGKYRLYSQSMLPLPPLPALPSRPPPPRPPLPHLSKPDSLTISFQHATPSSVPSISGFGVQNGPFSKLS